jgi:hypothetical protein
MRIKPHHHNAKPVDRSETLLVFVLALVFLGGLSAELLQGNEPRKIATVFFLAWWLPLVLVHEVGHALMAHLFDWKIARTVIGFGKVLYRGQLFNAPLELRLFPIEGFVQMQAPNGKTSRIKHALIYFAGPGIELLVFLGVVFSMGWANFFVIEDDYSKLIWQTLAYAALVGAVINLIPTATITHEGETPNDGMGIIWSLLGKI